jgi:hypothetical protein
MYPPPYVSPGLPVQSNPFFHRKEERRSPSKTGIGFSYEGSSQLKGMMNKVFQKTYIEINIAV